MAAKSINWEELARQKPHEIVLSGDKIAKQLKEESGQLSELVYGIKCLNFLEITDTPALKSISPSISKLENLTNLVLRGNKLTSIPESFPSTLKSLDLSRNQFESLPDGLFTKLANLQTLNLEQNKLESLPDMSGLVSLIQFKFGSNQIKQFPSTLCDRIYKKEYESESSPIPIYGGGAVHLSELIGSHNLIESIPPTIRRLVALKTLDLSFNQILIVPGELGDCPKLKELNLKENPMTKDRRLKKLIEQCPTKKQLDYIRANVPLSKESKEQDEKAAASAKSAGNGVAESGDLDVAFQASKTITIEHQADASNVFKVITTKQILQQRKIVACILHNIDLSNSKVLKKFIQVQTKLHQGICDNRKRATIATHDLAKILPPPVTFATRAAAGAPTEPPAPIPRVVHFDGRVPTKIKLLPLGRASEMTAMELYRSLNEEADIYRKEKKRNTISGVHKYLHLLKGKALYPVLMDHSKTKVLSLPPLTNADFTKLSANTTDVFVEVTGESVPTCREVMNELINQFLSIEVPSEEEDSIVSANKVDTIIAPKQDGTAGSLVIEPVMVETVEGELVVKYPAKIDLQLDNVQVETVTK